MACAALMQKFSSEPGLRVYRVPVFTKHDYKLLVGKRGSAYLFELFMEACKSGGCRFLGLVDESGYVSALLGFKEYGKAINADSAQRRCCAPE
jgi:hypothetical protein